MVSRDDFVSFRSEWPFPAKQSLHFLGAYEVFEGVREEYDLPGDIHDIAHSVNGIADVLRASINREQASDFIGSLDDQDQLRNVLFHLEVKQGEASNLKGRDYRYIAASSDIDGFDEILRRREYDMEGTVPEMYIGRAIAEAKQRLVGNTVAGDLVSADGDLRGVGWYDTILPFESESGESLSVGMLKGRCHELNQEIYDATIDRMSDEGKWENNRELKALFRPRVRSTLEQSHPAPKSPDGRFLAYTELMYNRLWSSYGETTVDSIIHDVEGRLGEIRSVMEAGDGVNADEEYDVDYRRDVGVLYEAIRENKSWLEDINDESPGDVLPPYGDVAF